MVLLYVHMIGLKTSFIVYRLIYSSLRTRFETKRLKVKICSSYSRKNQSLTVKYNSFYGYVRAVSIRCYLFFIRHRQLVVNYLRKKNLMLVYLICLCICSIIMCQYLFSLISFSTNLFSLWPIKNGLVSTFV